MTAEIVLQIFRFGFMLLLWLFIFAAFRVVRADLFGGRAGRVASVPPRAASALAAEQDRQAAAAAREFDDARQDARRQLIAVAIGAGVVIVLLLITVQDVVRLALDRRAGQDAA